MRLALLCVMAGSFAAWPQTPTPTPAPANLRVSVTARFMRPGEVLRLTIVVPAPARRVVVEGFGREAAAWMRDVSTWEALVGIDLDDTPGKHILTVTADLDRGTVKAAQPVEVAAFRFPTRTLTVDEGFVNPPESALARIQEDAALLGRTWKSSSASRLWTGPLARPVPETANSAFGTRSVYNGQPRSPHGGADFPSPAGTVIHSPGGGRVVLSRDLYYTGQTIVIDHGLGLFSLFAHLSDRAVQEGATVTAGETVGRVGATGRVTGPHLHWAIRLNGARVDPLSLLDVVAHGLL